MGALRIILAFPLALAFACTEDPQPAPSERVSPSTQIPGEPVLAIPGQTPPLAPPAFAPPVGDAGVDTERVGGRAR